MDQIGGVYQYLDDLFADSRLSSWREVFRRAKIGKSTGYGRRDTRGTVPEWAEFERMVTVLVCRAAEIPEVPEPALKARVDCALGRARVLWDRGRAAEAQLRQLRAKRIPRTVRESAAPNGMPGPDTGPDNPTAGTHAIRPVPSRRRRWAGAAVFATAVAALVTLASLDQPLVIGHPLPLKRYQAPAPGKANFISPTEPGPSGWLALPSLGMVYPAGQTGVPGLIPVYQYRCVAAVCEKLVYALFSEKGSKGEGWVYEREAFRCFDPAHPPAGTRPLYRLMHQTGRGRLWAVPGTPEYQAAVEAGFRDPDTGRGALCYIW